MCQIPNPDTEFSCILLVDDAIEEHRQLLNMLRPHYRVAVAFDGEQGYQRALALHPALILLDVRMPGMDGFTLCRWLKADPLTQAIPVIFLTSANAPEERIAGLTMGGVDYVVKPFVEAEVLARIRIHLELTRRSAAAPLPTAPQRHPDTVMATAAMRLISQHLRTPLPLAEIADALGVSKRKLTQIFREQTGFTVPTYIREERFNRARQLLAETDISIQDIAAEVGFENPANFATAFRDRMGITPRAYRQTMRQTYSHDAHADPDENPC